jgi:nitroimidazol reductase NimA-like FMN-containing flavoprotein (pyridoxamine 5'-phosphate oxidase superfamily)
VLFCTLAYVREGQPFQIPTGFCRMDDKLYVHGSVGSSYMREMASSKGAVCVSVTQIDGLVLARSAFHHSVNYRSVVLFSTPELVTAKDELYRALETFTNKMCPGRWNDIRQPSDVEWKQTMVLAFRIEEASAKVRTGPPIDDKEDYALDIWAGVQPVKTVRGVAEADPALKQGVKVPEYLR